jgi:hypothetical protein
MPFPDAEGSAHVVEHFVDGPSLRDLLLALVEVLLKLLEQFFAAAFHFLLLQDVGEFLQP